MRQLSYPGRSNVLAQNGMAATSNPLSSAEAINILQKGGNAIDAAIAELKTSLEAKDAEQDANVEAANKTAQRAEAMTEQNRSALRALNDKIDRMFRTISRK